MEQIQALAIIESLRSGIPTINSTRNLPDLRPDLLKYIENDLKQFEVLDTAPSGRMIWGTYGQGKSHFLHIIEHLALDSGFAVSRITLNRSLSSKDFYEFYGELAACIKIPKTNISGIEWQLTQKNINEFKANHFFSPDKFEHPLPLLILELFLSVNNTEFRNELYDILTGGQFTLKKLKDIAKSINKDHLFRDIPKFKKENILSFFGVFAQCIRFCGFKGWVLLIDEVELLGRLSKKARLKAYLNLNWLLNWSDEMEEPIYTICASATSLQDYYWFGGDRKRKDDSILMPELAEIIFGIEARDKISAFFQNAIENGLKLMPVNINEMRDYFNKLIDIYLLAYNLDINDKMGILYEIDNAIPRNMPIRTYIKGFIELLDGLQVTGKIQKINAQDIEEPVYYNQEEEKEEKQCSLKWENNND